MTIRFAGMLCCLALAGCAPTDPPADAPAAVDPPVATEQPAAPDTTATDQWLGQWTGPEGTFLRLEGGQGKYDITIQNLDGPRQFHGTAAGDHIQFERDGTQEVIRATLGKDTGMKWLAEKLDCLTIRPGEGYCRS